MTLLELIFLWLFLFILSWKYVQNKRFKRLEKEVGRIENLVRTLNAVAHKEYGTNTTREEKP